MRFYSLCFISHIDDDRMKNDILMSILKKYRCISSEDGRIPECVFLTDCSYC